MQRNGYISRQIAEIENFWFLLLCFSRYFNCIPTQSKGDPRIAQKKVREPVRITIEIFSIQQQQLSSNEKE